jgi:hypothetical protein
VYKVNVGSLLAAFVGCAAFKSRTLVENERDDRILRRAAMLLYTKMYMLVQRNDTGLCRQTMILVEDADDRREGGASVKERKGRVHVKKCGIDRFRSSPSSTSRLTSRTL